MNQLSVTDAIAAAGFYQTLAPKKHSLEHLMSTFVDQFELQFNWDTCQ
jgi:hypothetical protein